MEWNREREEREDIGGRGKGREVMIRSKSFFVK